MDYEKEAQAILNKGVDEYKLKRIIVCLEHIKKCEEDLKSFHDEIEKIKNISVIPYEPSLSDKNMDSFEIMDRIIKNKLSNN